MHVCAYVFWPGSVGQRFAGRRTNALKMDLSKVRRKHSIKMSVSSSVPVEDCSLAVDQAVGHSSVKAVGQMTERKTDGSVGAEGGSGGATEKTGGGGGTGGGR